MSVTINRKSHTDFRLISTSMTSDDLERRNSHYFPFFSPISVSLLAKYVTVVEERNYITDRPCWSWQMYDETGSYHRLAENTNWLRLLLYMMTAKRFHWASWPPWSRISPPTESNISSFQCSEKIRLAEVHRVRKADHQLTAVTFVICYNNGLFDLAARAGLDT